MNEEITIKAIDFSALQIGDKFFTSRQSAIEDKIYLTKIPSIKNMSGAWANAKGPISQVFVKYDSRVWVRK